MSQTISQNRVDYIRENQYKESLQRVASEQKKFERDYQSIVKKNEGTMKRLNDDYEVKVSNLKVKLDQKLAKMRAQHDKIMATEEKRLGQELKNLKSGHEDKVTELRKSQMNQLQEMKDSQKKILDQARERFIRAKAKWDVETA